MEEYLKKQKRKRIKNYCVGVFISILIVIIIALLYLVYQNIYLPNTSLLTPQKVDTTRISQTAEEVEEENKTITQVLEQVNECVVGISKLKNPGNTVFLEDGSSQLGLGTGMIVTENGYILTNEHVSGSKYSSCYVTLPSGKNYTANVVWSDSDIDLAIIKINAKNLPYVTLGDSSQVKVGEKVYAIGNPIGFEFQRTVTSGIISAVNRTITIEEEDKSSYMEDLIQTDATINPGNSGGPLINAQGEVIGINSVKITSAEGIGFAVPINTVKTIVEQFEIEGKFEEATLGIFAYDKNVIPYLNSNLQLDSGIYVVQVKTNSAAAKAGLKEKDILLSIDGIALEKMCDLRCYIYEKKSGDKVTLQVLRNQREMTVEVTLGRCLVILFKIVALLQNIMNHYIFYLNDSRRFYKNKKERMKKNEFILD